MKTAISAFFIGLLVFAGTPISLMAQHAGHQGHTIQAPGGETPQGGALEREESQRRSFLLDGLKVSVTLSPMAEHKKMLSAMKMDAQVDPQATHNIAVGLADIKTNQPLPEAVVKMKVIDPWGKVQIKLLDSIPAMNQFSGDFTLSEKGRYQILFMLKSGGLIKAGGFYFRIP